MNVVTLGPFAFAVARFAALAALVVFLIAIGRIERSAGRKRALGHWPTILILAWLVAARTGYVIAQWPAFAEAPLDILKLWQGGFSPAAGALGGGLVLALAALRRRAVFAPLVTATALAAAVGALVLQLQQKPDTPAMLVPFTLADLSGQPVQLDARDGRPLVLNLWASWCGPCRRELPMMQALASRETGIDVVFANQGETTARILDFLDSAELTRAGILRDPDQALMSHYGAIGLPATLFFRVDGSLAHGAVGEISRAELMRLIDDIRPGGPE